MGGDLNRRTILGGASAVLATSLLKSCSTPPAVAGPRDAFAGSRAGDAREIAGVKMCWCPPGSFTMGTPPGEVDRRPYEDMVDVTLSGGFWIGKYSVTQGQWRQVAGDLPGELSAGAGPDLPVYNVNFPEAERFSDQLTSFARASGALPQTWVFRLPTEAQWEYACRAGTRTATYFGNSLSSFQANFRGNKPYNGASVGPVLAHTERVGAYPANAWGLHDMHGNVFDWRRDWFHARYRGGLDPDLWNAKDTAARNGDGSLSRSRRGGCWSDEGWACRSGFRLRYEPERRADHIGTRVVAVRL